MSRITTKPPSMSPHLSGEGVLRHFFYIYFGDGARATTEDSIRAFMKMEPHYVQPVLEELTRLIAALPTMENHRAEMYRMGVVGPRHSDEVDAFIKWFTYLRRVLSGDCGLPEPNE